MNNARVTAFTVFELLRERQQGGKTRQKFLHLINYDTLLQNATDIITKSDSYFITKCEKFITKCARSFITSHNPKLTPKFVFSIKRVLKK